MERPELAPVVAARERVPAQGRGPAQVAPEAAVRQVEQGRVVQAARAQVVRVVAAV
jgi:hypothetical protein